MTQFIRLLSDKDKSKSLLDACVSVRQGLSPQNYFEVETEEFKAIPGSPFVYWVNESLRSTFKKFPAFETGDRIAKQGLASADDFRFLRLWWEIPTLGTKWFGFAKGGSYSPYYSDVYLLVNWADNGAEIKNNLNDRGGVRSNVWMLGETSTNYFFRRAITWPRRAHLKGSFKALPEGCIFADLGPCAFGENLESLSAILNSSPFIYLLHLLMPRGTEGGQTLKYEVGYVASVPVPIVPPSIDEKLMGLFLAGFQAQRALDYCKETSHAFILPSDLLENRLKLNLNSFRSEVSRVKEEIDTIVFELYGFKSDDKNIVLGLTENEHAAVEEDDAQDDLDVTVDDAFALLSWTVGVAFGHFDWRWATGERLEIPKVGPFDRLPSHSAAMLQSGSAPFQRQIGVLVDDQGHACDITRIVEEVFTKIDLPAPDDIRRQLRKDFFPTHLQLYSKSRRKAPIYWPLATDSGSYTLWLYYPSLTSQTLYSAVNDFVEPKLIQVEADVTTLRNKGGARNRDDEKQLEVMQALELELIEFRDTLLKLAPNYKPFHDDGVQISAAPLWSLFRYKPWHKVLKETWVKLEKGEYDWSHLAKNYWPDRVREKCKTDKSLAIAHGLDHLFVEPVAQLKKTGKKKMTGGDE